MSTATVTPDQFAERVKQKYPQYKDVPNAELTQRIVAKYPQYKSQIAEAPAESSPVSDFLSEAWKKLNPVTALSGMAQATSHPIDTLKQDALQRQGLYSDAKKRFQGGDYVGSAAQALYGSLPLIGPQLSEAGQQFERGDIAKGAGASTGLGLSMVLPEKIPSAYSSLKGALKKPAASVAGKLYSSALKPSTTLSAGERASVIKTGLQNEIRVSPEGLSKIGDLINDMSGQVDSTIASKPGAAINKFDVASRLNETYGKFKNQVTPAADLREVVSTGKEFLKSQPRDILAADAQSLKKGTYQQLNSKAYGELKSASVESQKALARGIKEELENVFPELKELNAKQGALYGLQPELVRAINRAANKDVVGISAPIAAAAAEAVSGSGKVGGAALVMKWILDQPSIKSRVAISLAKASKGTISQAAAFAKVAAYSDALGNLAANGGTNDDPATE